MGNSYSAEVWLDERRWDALEAALEEQGTNIEKYLQDFHWDESRFPERNSIGEHKNLIQQDTRSVESELRKMLQKYQDVHSNVTALRRKRGQAS